MLNGRAIAIFVIMLVPIVCWFSAPLPVAGQAETDIKIGMMDNLFEEQEEKKIMAQIDPFAALVRKQTMTKGTFSVSRGLDSMVEDLKADRLQMGVMHGLDYAWLKQRVPDAKPLLIAFNDTTTLKALLVVPKDSQAKSVLDLKNKDLAFNSDAPYHVRFWLNELAGGKYDGYFKVLPQDKVDAALEEVADRAAAATALSGGAFDYYKGQKPVRAEKLLKVLAESPEFPCPVMVYRPGKVKSDVVQRFRTSMLSAHESGEGKDTLSLWRLKRFVDIPANYDQLADDIAKRYPPK